MGINYSMIKQRLLILCQRPPEGSSTVTGVITSQVRSLITVSFFGRFLLYEVYMRGALKGEQTRLLHNME